MMPPPVAGRSDPCQGDSRPSGRAGGRAVAAANAHEAMAGGGRPGHLAAMAMAAAAAAADPPGPDGGEGARALAPSARARGCKYQQQQ